LTCFGDHAGAQSSSALQNATSTQTAAEIVVPPVAHNRTDSIPQPATSNSLKLLVDGQLSPGLIPDQVAYRHLISVTAVSAGASVAETRRRDAILTAVGLSDVDRRNYIDALTTVGSALEGIQQRMQAAHADISTLDSLKQQKGQVMDSAASRVMSSLSAEGAARLRKHIDDRVKTHIRMYSQAQQ